jgi:hypothetical protein
MFYFAVKIIVTSVLIVTISEVAKRSSLIGALLASVPLISVLAMVWLYIDTKNIEKISALSTNIVWLVIPSLPLFIVLPVLLKRGMSFYLSLSISLSIMIIGYCLIIIALGKYGVEL